MIQHTLIRTLLSVWIAITLSFVALRVLPGDALDARLTQSGASAEAIALRREMLGIGKPVLEQYLDYWRGLLSGDLGVSLLNGLPVVEILGRGLAATFQLAFSALGMAIVIGFSLGYSAEQRTYRWLRALVRWAIDVALSVPIYVTALIAIYIFALTLDLLPSGGAGSAAHLMLPMTVLGFHGAGGIAQSVRMSLLEYREAPFVRTAIAKGLPQGLILRRHILRVGLIPIITVIGLQLGFLLSGTVITESVFSRPGIGTVLLSATLDQDYPVVQGGVLVVVVCYILINNLANLLYHAADPRLRR